MCNVSRLVWDITRAIVNLKVVLEIGSCLTSLRLLRILSRNLEQAPINLGNILKKSVSLKMGNSFHDKHMYCISDSPSKTSQFHTWIW